MRVSSPLDSDVHTKRRFGSSSTFAMVAVGGVVLVVLIMWAALRQDTEKARRYAEHLKQNCTKLYSEAKTASDSARVDLWHPEGVSGRTGSTLVGSSCRCLTRDCSKTS